MKHIILTTILFLSMTSMASAQSAPEPLDLGEPESVRITTQNGEHSFIVEVADEPQEQSRGLMYREHLAPNHGMLFEYTKPQVVSIWMKNTGMSLDVIFIHKSGKIQKIEHKTRPYSLRSISSEVPVSAILEILGGRAKELGIVKGDVFTHKPNLELRHSASNAEALKKVATANTSKTNGSTPKSSSPWLGYDSSTPVLDTILFGVIGMAASGSNNSNSSSSNNSYGSSYSERDSNEGSSSQTSNSSNRQNSNKTGGYQFLEHITYGSGQKVVARGKCSDGTRFDVRYSPDTGASYQYTIYSTSGSSKDNVAKKFCRNH